MEKNKQTKNTLNFNYFWQILQYDISDNSNYWVTLSLEKYENEGAVFAEVCTKEATV